MPPTYPAPPPGRRLPQERVRSSGARAPSPGQRVAEAATAAGRWRRRRRLDGGAGNRKGGVAAATVVATATPGGCAPSSGVRALLRSACALPGVEGSGGGDDGWAVEAATAAGGWCGQHKGSRSSGDGGGDGDTGTVCVFLRSACALPRAEGDGGEWRRTEPKCTCTELKPRAVSLDESSSGPAHGVGTVAVQACSPGCCLSQVGTRIPLFGQWVRGGMMHGACWYSDVVEQSN